MHLLYLGEVQSCNYYPITAQCMTMLVVFANVVFYSIEAMVMLDLTDCRSVS